MPKKCEKPRANMVVRIDKDVLDSFNRVYPDLLNIFLTRAVKAATIDKQMFEKIFFDYSEVY